MKAAVVGAGFAGLSVAWHLLSRFPSMQCTLFDEAGVGLGTSGIASGLLHPFPAAATEYSFMGKEALHESLSLLNIARGYSEEKIAEDSGVLKLALQDEEKKHYSALSRRYERLQWVSAEALQHDLKGIMKAPALWIEQGVTVFCDKYLQALWKACEAQGASLEKQKIQTLEELEGYDLKILCVGAAIKQFDPEWKLKWIKGQILTCKAPYPLTSKSIIARGYLSVTGDPCIYHLGSTYEHHYQDSAPSLEKAKEQIFGQARHYISCLDEIEIVECRAGVRVTSPHTHLPQIKKYREGVYALTALGSRGLLYHGLLGKQLAESLLFGEDERISREFFVSQR